MAHESQRLDDEAAAALRRGEPALALDRYLALEALEPREGGWPQRAAEILRRLGDRAGEIAALGRAAERFAEAGRLPRAIALCKLLLAADPAHVGTPRRLATLCAARGLTTGAPPVAAVQALEVEAPLEEILLADAVPGARPFDLGGRDDASGVSEIPLGETRLPDELERAATRLRADDAARGGLRHTPFFGDLDEDSLRRVIEGLRLVTLREGDTLFRQGEAADALYVVAEGAVVSITEGSPRKRLACLEEGELFGEIGLVTDCARTATVEAQVDARVLQLERGLVARVVAREPRALHALLGFLRDRWTAHLVRSSSLFAALAADDRVRLARRVRFLEAAPGSRLVEQGQAADALFVLLCGRAAALRVDGAGERPLGALEAGDVFGELSLLSGEAAAASVVASTKCWLVALDRAEVRALLAAAPRIGALLGEISAERRRATASPLARARDRRLDVL